MAENKVQLGFYFDQTRCMSCNACTVACKDWNQVNPGPVAWRKQFTYELNGKFFPFAMGCNHCAEPACMNACTVGAISKSEDGIVTVDRNKCQNLQACISACPFAKPQIAGDKQEPNAIIGWTIQHPMQKCTMCKDRLDKGEKPACVQACVGRALDFGNMDDLRAKYTDAVQLTPDEFSYVYVNNKNDTKPSILVKKRTDTTNNIIKPGSLYKA